MIIINIPQRTPEWNKLRSGSIGGTRFSQVVSGKKNRLVYDLLSEKLGYFVENDYVDEVMQYGIDNEPYAAAEYEKISGIEFREIGMIKSETVTIHHASPDRISKDNTICLEIKCTENVPIHLQRYFEGFEQKYVDQCVNYFAVADEIKEVHLISYCPYFVERPVFCYILKREDYTAIIEKGRKRIAEIENELQTKLKMIV